MLYGFAVKLMGQFSIAMRNLIESARALIGLALFVICLVLSFKGFPLALVSLTGSLLMLIACTQGVAAIFHKEESPMTLGANYSSDSSSSRFIRVCIAFAIAAFGSVVINWGGLASINIGQLTLDFKVIAVAIGVLGGLVNIDKRKG